jgi:hypothetical protein
MLRRVPLPNSLKGLFFRGLKVLRHNIQKIEIKFNKLNKLNL